MAISSVAFVASGNTSHATQSPMIRAVIADDELLARHKLRLFLRAEPDIEIVGESATAAETLDLVRLARPDLLFLDIRMPDMDTFHVLDILAGDADLALPHIIFTTAHSGYAIRAFEIHAADYLLKPFSAERLGSALQRVRQQMEAAQTPAQSGRDAPLRRPWIRRIVFKSRGRILFLPVSEILWIGAEENYLRLYTRSETHWLRETMTHIEKTLDPDLFLRVHRSSIVNLHYIREVRTEKDGEAAVLLSSGQQIPMSRGYRSRIEEQLQHESAFRSSEIWLRPRK